MLWGGVTEGAGLEVRRQSDGGARLSGRFPYNSRAVLSDGGKNGRPRKEQFAPGAFSYTIENKTEVHLLAGHSFDRPLASVGAGTLALKDNPDALTFSATILPALMELEYVRAILAGIAAGLVIGVSPGFRIPPPRTVPDAERVEEEDPAEGTALIRTIFAAILFELSLVSRPAYPETQIEARNWQPDQLILPVRVHPSARWRA